METTVEKMYVDVPTSDLKFFNEFVRKMGWKAGTSKDAKEKMWDRFVRSCPENVDLTDEEIMEEVRAVRYDRV